MIIIEEEQGWTENTDTLDPSLFDLKRKYQAIRINYNTTKEDANISQNTHLNEMTTSKHNQFMKT